MNMDGGDLNKKMPVKERTSPSFGSILIDFLAGTSAHGLPRVASEISLIRKLFWGIVFLGAFTVFIYLMYISCVNFMERPVGIYINYIPR